MMKTVPNRRGTFLAAALAIVIAMVATVAVARAAVPQGGNSLTVGLCDNADWKGDFATSSPEVTAVRIAAATQHEADDGYDYDFGAAGFGSVTLPPEPTNEDWQEAAREAARLVTAETDSVTTGDGGTVHDLADGVYLVLPHNQGTPLAYGAEIESSLYVDTAGWTYRFAPTIVVLPSRPADGQGWNRDVTVTAKPTREPGQGSVRIDKSVLGSEGEEAMFVYEIVGTDSSGAVAYRESRSIWLPAGDAGNRQASVVVGDVPTGLSISVTESYPGAGYELVDSAVPDDAVTRRDYQPTFSFTNRKGGGGTVGGGIANSFTYDEDGNRDWTWHAEPDGKAGEQS